MFVTPAYAQATGGGGDLVVSLLPFILIFVIMYVILIRPQQKKAREHEALVKQLKVGDKVVTNGGGVGVIVGVKDRSFSIRSADSKLEILRNAVAEVVPEK